MLCAGCAGIVIDPKLRRNIRKPVRRYDNVWTLQASAAECELCACALESLDILNGADSAPYVHARWGSAMWNRLLDKSSITIYHVINNTGDHDLLAEIVLEAVSDQQFTGGPHRYIASENLGGIYGSSSLPDLMPGQAPMLLTSAHATISYIRSKLTECTLKHAGCMSRSEDRFVPRRLVRQTGNRVHLVLDPPIDITYAALSYCWGDGNMELLTKHSLDALVHEGISHTALPQTLQDALMLCAGVGVDFLWIDCLCIVQDSAEDWSLQSGQMAMIFNHSIFAIKAAAGADSQHGLFQVRRLHTRRVIPLKLESVTTDNVSCFLRGVNRLNSNEAADQRAWILQESLLAKRLISFGSGQLVWQCPSDCWVESGMTLEVASQSGLFPRPRLIDPCESDLRNETHRPSAIAIWQDAVTSFCTMRMTLDRDKLPAVSGIATWMQPHLAKHGDSGYIAGLWTDHLPGSLLWYQYISFPDFTRNSYQLESYRAPSWSWAATDGPVLKWIMWQNQKVYAQVIECQITLKDLANPYGEVLDGHIVLTASTKRGGLFPGPHALERFLFANEAEEVLSSGHLGGPELGAAHFDSIELNKAWIGHDSTPKWVPWSCQCVRITSGAGLLIEQVDSQDESGTFAVYKRLGLVLFTADHAAAWWESAPTITIKLI